MDLKSGPLYWPHVTAKPPQYDALNKAIHCDVAVIGAGLTGAAVAHKLAREGYDTVVLDRRNVGCGSSSASTALVLYEIDTQLHQLIRLHGERDAVKSYRCCLRAIPALRDLVRGIRSHSDFALRPALYLANSKDHVPALKKEFKARRKFGFNVEYLSQVEVEAKYSFSAPGAILSADAAEVNPLQLTHDLIRDAVRYGARVFTNTKVTNRECTPRAVRIETESGNSVKARWAVIASGYETKNSLIRSLVKLQSTYVLVTKPVKDFSGWPDRCLIWDTGDPYFYLRTTPDDRVMIGGADASFANPAKRDRVIAQKTRRLMSRVRELFPSMHAEPAFRWAGTFGQTRDGFPYIGRAEEGSRELYALCYGANGTNFAMIAREVICDIILGRRNHQMKLFALER